MTNNKQLPTRFDEYEIHGVREVGRSCEQVADEEAQFWSLFGHIPGQGLECIGDFASRAFAEEVYARITGRPYGNPEPLDEVEPDRVAKFNRVILDYTDSDRDTNLVDLLADAMHWSRTNGVSFEQSLITATTHFSAETNS